MRAFRHLALETLQLPPQLVAQPLLLEHVAEPGAQQDRVERLGKVVLRAQLDAPPDRFHLARGRDHDDRGGRQQSFRGQRLEHLHAVQMRHHHIEQDDVIRRRGRPDCVDRHAPVLGMIDAGMTQPHQPSAQHIPLAWLSSTTRKRGDDGSDMTISFILALEQHPIEPR